MRNRFAKIVGAVLALIALAAIAVALLPTPAKPPIPSVDPAAEGVVTGGAKP